jgi:hypothetical protein
MMNDWMKQRDLLIQETLEFVQGISTDSKIGAPSTQRIVEGNVSVAAAKTPVVVESPAPHDRLNMERTAIQRRLENFKANQQRFQREREEYFQNTITKARDNTWTPENPDKR